MSKKTKAKANNAKKPAKALKTPLRAKKPVQELAKRGDKAKPKLKKNPINTATAKSLAKKTPSKKVVLKKNLPAKGLKGKSVSKAVKKPSQKSAAAQTKAYTVKKASGSVAVARAMVKGTPAQLKKKVHQAAAKKLAEVKLVPAVVVSKVEKALSPPPTALVEESLPVAEMPVIIEEMPKKAPLKTTGKVSIAYESPVRPSAPPVRRDSPVKTGSTVKDGGAIFYDSHMHTPLCKHASGETEEYAEQGIRAGLRGIIFTCHCPMPNGFWPTVRMDESEFDSYVAMVNRATQKYKGKLDVWLGIESEYYPGYEKYIEELHQRADFHFVLGSVHWQSKEYLGKFENGTIEGFRRTYFNHLADSAESGLYDCLGHPDLVKNYHPDSWCFPILKEHVSRCLDRIAATGVAMELNTSGLNKSYHEMNPGNEFLSMMAARNIPLVIGSDAHRQARVGEHFIQALENAKAAGYNEVNYFEWRKRKTLKLDDVLASLQKNEAKKAG